uniref:CULT domain-containing protein n=1 Tax=Chromera velia CCMP2878 TaxID=1169474 RepID=A0A0G4F8K8_9ALVE|mmetsp:Transcript_48775/g.96232  ORF Transcript_48775/g.96232 Transcript_48775/m.96232 type:complete len:198 (+) Transcript_48775:321-914(+)|eukprot:Cvel_2910.t1-p1 / transcript=Cvel_2910.t1 / gene=Cvel_2910 / organism=Chromera_velia_CCMP2878 / gene_product=hypothetical protein / transcript_product=hypothetical protein / location=Cvel_scaffold115:57788-58378(-) / protein_length=197 / sequence_SO=supercontig / SO=protein_coding / is_pseudo=false
MFHGSQGVDGIFCPCCHALLAEPSDQISCGEDERILKAAASKLSRKTRIRRGQGLVDVHRLRFTQSFVVNWLPRSFDTFLAKRIIRNVIVQPRPPEFEVSWFRGYGWQILLCDNAGCGEHIGWKFTCRRRANQEDQDESPAVFFLLITKASKMATFLFLSVVLLYVFYQVSNATDIKTILLSFVSFAFVMLRIIPHM